MKKADAAYTLYKIQNTTLFDLIVTEVTDTVSVENLFRDFINEDGLPAIKKVRDLENFRIGDYV